MEPQRPLARDKGVETDEEVAQDAFVRLLEHWGKVRGYADPEAWLRAVAVRLPVAQRAALVLHHVHDLSVDEVADVLHVPTGTVKSRLSRARAALAPLLADEERSTT